MKRSIFFRYYAVFVTVILLAFAMLVGYTTLSSSSFSGEYKRDHMEMYARNMARAITDYMVIGEVDLPTLMETRQDLLETTIRTRASQEKLLLFVTDEKGVVLLSSDESALPPGATLSASVMELALAPDRDDPFFEDDLGGLLDRAATVRAIPMEETGADGSSRTVAAAFAVAGVTAVEQFLTGLTRGFLAVTALVIVITLVTFLHMSQKMNQPIRILSRAAERYVKGDFSQKLPEEGNGEMDALMVTFNEMAGRLEQNERDRQLFIANVSHDLRTPLTAIGGYTQNMLEERIPPEKQKHYLRVIFQETGRLSRMVDSLLEATRVTGGGLKLDLRPVDLCELARVTLLSFENILESLQADVRFDAKPERLSVTVDRDAVQRVIFNLIDNAAKFTPAGGDISIRIREQDKKAIFSIRNTGDGIPAEELPQLFDRFYKSDRSRGLDKRGVGLGLFIAKSIINAHGEDIWVTSRVGSWTEFVFTLPLSK